MANNVNRQQIIDLPNHPDNFRSAFIQVGRARLKRNSRTRFVEPKCDRFRIFGEEARSIAERIKIDHLNAHYHDSSFHGQALQNSSLRDSNSFSQIEPSPILRYELAILTYFDY